jgi:hypothetical protein
MQTQRVNYLKVLPTHAWASPCKLPAQPGYLLRKPDEELSEVEGGEGEEVSLLLWEQKTDKKR